MTSAIALNEARPSTARHWASCRSSSSTVMLSTMER
jgi:hypothetical protein